MGRTTGHYITTSTFDEEVRAFVPAPLPPQPPLQIDEAMAERLARAELELARLNVAGQMVPSPEWFIYGFVRKEAVLSSQIEGTRASLLDVLTFDAGPEGQATGADVHEVMNYLAALQYGREQIADDEGLPLSLRLIRNMHALLMQGESGLNKQPGEFRRSQNWIGGTRPGNARYVPPPPPEMLACLNDLEHYIHRQNQQSLPILIQLGLIHVQFETIHPFLDGNGRLGRLLVALLLEYWGLLDLPLLYLSLYLKRHRSEYFGRLTMAREFGDWEGWINFFLDGIITVSQEGTQAARALFTLFERDRHRLLAARGASITAARLLEFLPSHPILTTGQAVNLLDTTKPTAAKAIGQLLDLGILQDISGRLRGRTFTYNEYLRRLGADMDGPYMDG